MAIRRSSVRLFAVCSLLVMQVAVSQPASAAPGDLDPTFGIGGVVTTNFGPGSSGGASVQALVRQPDGKIVAVGYAAFSSESVALARYESNGSLDPSFGAGGRVTTPVGGTFAQARAASLQPDGKIVVAGFTFLGVNPSFVLLRYLPDGSLDPSFGTGGLLTSIVGTAQAVLVQPDGKIVVGGSTAPEPTDFVVARYGSDGTLDASFGTGGRVTTDFFGIDDWGAGMALQPDGKILLGGSASNLFGLVRYNTDGTLDTTFGVGGKVTSGFGATASSANALALAPDGRIVLAGITGVYPDIDFGVARYSTGGALDPSFGSGGTATTDFFGGFDMAEAVAVQGDGSIIVAGNAAPLGVPPGSTTDFALARLDAEGNLDGSFGMGGKIITQIGFQSRSRALMIQPDQAIVAAGLTSDGNNTDFALARYLGTNEADSLKLDVFWGPKHSRTLAYRNAGNLTAGDYKVDPATGRPLAISGTGTIPSTVSGDATVAFDIAFDDATKKWSGTVVVNDPGAGFSATVPIHSWRFGVTRDGTTTRGVLWGFKAQSVPKKCFMLVFEIDDLG
jgi:uncharacterized delta-60 repeat protein